MSDEERPSPNLGGEESGSSLIRLVSGFAIRILFNALL
jgi:hypothetical protein